MSIRVLGRLSNDCNSKSLCKASCPTGLLVDHFSYFEPFNITRAQVEGLAKDVVGHIKAMPFDNLQQAANLQCVFADWLLKAMHNPKKYPPGVQKLIISIRREMILKALSELPLGGSKSKIDL